jgi:hypothetical protein
VEREEVRIKIINNILWGAQVNSKSERMTEVELSKDVIPDEAAAEI